MELVVVPASDWGQYAAEAHMACFSEKRDPNMDRVDYVLLIIESDKALAYAMIREVDAMTAYMQYGGAFPEIRGTLKVVKAYAMMLAFLGGKYTYATTLIENTNKPMLKLAMANDWLIKGLRFFEGSILLEHQIKFTRGVA